MFISVRISVSVSRGFFLEYLLLFACRRAFDKNVNLLSENERKIEIKKIVGAENDHHAHFSCAAGTINYFYAPQVLIFFRFLFPLSESLDIDSSKFVINDLIEMH